MTDHKPLTTLFNPDKPLPVLASGKIQRCAIFLMNYQFTIQFRPTNKHTNVDALSRLPLDNQEFVSTNNVLILQLQKFQEIRVTVKQVAEGIQKNPLLSKVLHYVKMGWPQKVEPALSPYFATFTSKPWQRIHLDFAGPFQRQMWLILIDSYSRWPEVVPMKTTTASQTIKELRLIFARFGLPEQILTDNSLQFVSEEFQEFTSSNGIQHIKITHYHPRSNGMAERFV